MFRIMQNDGDAYIKHLADALVKRAYGDADSSSFRIVILGDGHPEIITPHRTTDEIDESIRRNQLMFKKLIAEKEPSPFERAMESLQHQRELQQQHAQQRMLEEYERLRAAKTEKNRKRRQRKKENKKKREQSLQDYKDSILKEKEDSKTAYERYKREEKKGGSMFMSQKEYAKMLEQDMLQEEEQERHTVPAPEDERLLTDYIAGVDPAIRTNTDYVFAFESTNHPKGIILK